MKLLAFYEQVYVFTKYYSEIGKCYARQWLGPAPQKYLLLADGQVLPSAIQLPSTVSAHLYDPSTNRITSMSNPSPEGRYKPLQYISMRMESEIVGNIDMSDWLGELRANPVPNLSIKQIMVLWSLTQNTYVPFDGETTVFVTKNNGSEETVTF